MNLAKYSELTGITVTNQALIEAQIKRTRSVLEAMLGYTLCPDKIQENLYNELGKTQSECTCPNVINTEDLNAPDDVEGAYRLFNYNPHDKYFHIDPFATIFKVKLVYIRPGEGDQGITIKAFDNDQVRVHLGRDGWSKYLEHCRDCLCLCDCQDCLQLAVDADWQWADCIPLELLYVWADMVTYYTDCKKDVKSENIQGHSYTKFDRILPENLAQNYAVIQRYAGPHGSAVSEPTI